MQYRRTVIYPDLFVPEPGAIHLPYIERFHELTKAAIGVLCCYCLRDQTGQPEPTLSELLAFTNMGRQAAWKGRRRLEEKGMLLVSEIRGVQPYKVAINIDLRWLVWERDNFTCQHCGIRRNLAVDHIIPESKGGDLSLDNLQTLCRTCNSRKGVK